MNAPLIAQWQRLILPPEDLPIRAGEQLPTGNRYPDTNGPPDFAAHLAGRRTYAVNLAYTGQDGSLWCKVGVLDIDEGPESLTKARALLAVCQAQGLSCLAAWSGSKGCHVWVFFEPAPVPLVQAALRKLKAAVPFTGDVIPGDNQRVKLPPAKHQVARLWAFWFDTLPRRSPKPRKPAYGLPSGSGGHPQSGYPNAIKPAGSLRRGHHAGNPASPGGRYGPRLGQTWKRTRPLHGFLPGTWGTVNPWDLG